MIDGDNCFDVAFVLMHLKICAVILFKIYANAAAHCTSF